MKISGNIIMGFGMLFVSTSLLLDGVASNLICDIMTGVGIGLELVGLIKQCKEKRN